MIRNLVVLLFLIFSISAYSQEEKNAEQKKAEEKIYSQAELDEAVKKAIAEKVNAQVDEQIKKITPKNLISFSKDLLKKEEELKKKEELITKREGQLDVNKNAFVKRIGEFDKKQKKILGCIEQNEQKVSNRVNHIVKVISNMKPVNAAQVLSTQDPDISVKILGILDAVKAAKIFNLMDKEVSARLQKQYLHMKQ